jgi:phosphopantothenoylcysteine decarboxylase/phosphopantothenate--cysteine ligase
MLEAVLNESADADALIMAAAVADFRPKLTAENKLKKKDGIPQIELEATDDILEAVLRRKTGGQKPGKAGSNGPCITVGFAAESTDLLENAAEKLRSKKLDLLIANDISSKDAGFGMDTNRVTLLYPNGTQEPLSLMTKTEAAEIIIDRVAALLE